MASITSIFTRRQSSINLKPFSEAHARLYHCAVPVSNKLYMWGGITAESDSKMNALASVVDVYDPFLEVWETHPTTGTAPPPVHNAAFASAFDSMYTFGGEYDFWCNSLHELDTTTLCWNEVEVKNASEGPLPKEGCGMVMYQDYKLVLFGGYGTALDGTSEQRRRVLRDHDGTALKHTGWLNELHIFSLRDGFWLPQLWTYTTGFPEACSNFSFTSVDPKRAVLFGGMRYSNSLEETYIFDLQQMHWNQLRKPLDAEWPQGRRHHAACCLNYGQEHPQLLVTGGESYRGGRGVLRDSWLLDVDSGSWKEIYLPAEVPPRAGHTATAFSLAPGLTEVVMFGGYFHGTTYGWPQWIAETFVLHFEHTESPLSTSGPEWTLMGVASGEQLGSLERVREKMIVLHQRNTESIDQALIDIQTTTQDLQEKVEIAEEAMEYAEWKVENPTATSSRVIKEKQRKADKAKKQAEKLENQLAKSQKAAQSAVERAREAEWRAEYAEQRAVQVERRAHSDKREQPFWVVKRDDFHLTGEKLSGKARPVVQVANFRGIRVAAKRRRDLAPSEHNRTIFMREMNVAARIHHPNIVQFIGATLEGELIILTELMPTSLRAQLERGALPHHQIISISLDVARALNYLHLMQPDPILHRNLCSATVLLKTATENSWKAKIVNFREKMSEMGPYVAPESNDPSQQSPKMDIFSFGVLLVEICTGTFPDTADRERLIQLIADHRMVGLIRECTAEDRNERPSAVEIIARLNEM